MNPEDNTNDYFDAKLYHIYISDPIDLTARIYLQEGEYEEDDLGPIMSCCAILSFEDGCKSGLISGS